MVTRTLSLLGLWGLSAILLYAFVAQIVQHDLPCPLCLLQRAAFTAAGIGFALNVQFGTSRAHYGITLLSALTGAGVSTRQILLHIVPGTGTYGEPFLGLHFYTWGLIMSVLIAIAVGVMLLIDGDREPRRDRIEPAGRGARLAIGVFLALALANTVSTFLLCGFGICADDVMSYRMLRW